MSKKKSLTKEENKIYSSIPIVSPIKPTIENGIYIYSMNTKK